MTTNLDVFDIPVKQFLETHIKAIGHSVIELQPVINAAIIVSKSQLGDSWRTQNERLIRSRVERAAVTYIDAVLGQSKIWNDCRERIKAYRSIVLAGAGLSYDSDIPLTSILKDVLKFVGAKDWQELRADPAKCLAFKKQFGKICAGKNPSKSHEILITNYPKYIFEILSLNWDDLIEKAAIALKVVVSKQNVDTTALTTNCLWKFHGDIGNITQDNIPGQGGWIFPDEQGYVFESFKKYVELTNLKSELFTFLIVGYSEQEKTIYDEIVTLMESNPPRPTYRIGLDLKNLNQPSHIVGTAGFILNKVLVAG